MRNRTMDRTAHRWADLAQTEFNQGEGSESEQDQH